MSYNRLYLHHSTAVCTEDGGKPVSALISAVVKGDVKAVKAPLDKGANATESYRGAPFLATASYRGHLKALKLLIAKEADANSRYQDTFLIIF